MIWTSHAGLIVTITKIESYPDAPRSAPFPDAAIHGHDIVTAKIERVFFGDFEAGDEIQILQPRYPKLECPPGRPCRSMSGVRPALVFRRGEGPVAMYKFYAEKAYVRPEGLVYAGLLNQKPYSMKRVLELVESRKAALRESRD